MLTFHSGGVNLSCVGVLGLGDWARPESGIQILDFGPSKSLCTCKCDGARTIPDRFPSNVDQSTGAALSPLRSLWQERFRPSIGSSLLLDSDGDQSA